MSQGVVTDYLVSLIRKQVEDHALVVWYDPEEHYREVAATLMLPKTQVARYDGSFFQLRHEIDSLLNDLQPPRLVVYVPLDQTRTGHALIELEAVGVVIQPGQQPPSRNTRLSVVARNALKPILSEESADDVERQAETGKLSLADLDALADTGEVITKGVVSLTFGSGNPQDVARAFLASDRHDAEVEKKTAVAELAGLLQDVFGVELPSGEPLPALRSRLARYVLATDLIAGLQGIVPPSMSSVKVAVKPAAREACHHLARTWRLRRDVRECYVAASKQVETELGLSQVELPSDRLADIETFLAVERALLRQVETGLLDHPTEALLALAESRLSRFWSEVLPGIQAHWALIAKAAHVLLEADRVVQATKGKTADALDLIRSYAEGDCPWCLLDTHHRHMESRWYNFESEPGQRNEGLERLVIKATERYMAVGSALAEHFLDCYRKVKLPLKGIARQVEVYETRVKPSLAVGKTAYMWVDALRFEMARELCGVLADDFEISLQPAIGTVPTITEIGMAALLPGAHETARVVPMGGGKLALEIGDTTIKDRKDRVEFLRTHSGVPVFDAKLDDLLPKPVKKIKESIRDAQLVLITSQEIDELCERDNLTQARRQMDGVLNDLRRGVRVLGELGVNTIVLAADHGHLFGDEVGDDMKIEAPGGETADLPRRVWVGWGGTSEPSYLRAPL
ncbi:MAG: PglZ domain-containing protein, partial [Planctomycetaceae bacterium]|nr:PglZ domain-containing protein [Planctomycetaceae bacterium]